jgi:hypothetical protein
VGANSLRRYAVWRGGLAQRKSLAGLSFHGLAPLRQGFGSGGNRCRFHGRYLNERMLFFPFPTANRLSTDFSTRIGSRMGEEAAKGTFSLPFGGKGS